ncbi:YdcF family protein [Neorhizobium lilium]|uniref:YdcF family protein n=1 Tax=Neorhizobium lilium TaxID=2503024 RepID=A0A444LKR2_9HYPH|nr:YdcF family protein [Neorhizobium lilium]RWX80895.1 YdcF family protein [Neorhizobium lilium]
MNKIQSGLRSSIGTDVRIREHLTSLKMHNSLRRPMRISICLATILLVGLWVYAIALVLADTLLTQRDVVRKADVIVVLGGDGPPRAAEAASLWREGRAPSLLVSGYGDCGSIRQTMIEEGVTPAAIRTECLSSNTWENASFSQPILAAMGVQCAILVTSWYHSKRAMKRFRSVMPGVRWISVPAERTRSYWKLAFEFDGIQIFKEYAKTLVYDLRSLMSELAVPITAVAQAAAAEARCAP